MRPKTFTHRGVTIQRDAFRYRVPSMPWGDQPGEYPSFKSLAAAQTFIDHRLAERPSPMQAQFDRMTPDECEDFHHTWLD